jgi:hypothetical protein
VQGLYPCETEREVRDETGNKLVLNKVSVHQALLTREKVKVMELVMVTELERALGTEGYQGACTLPDKFIYKIKLIIATDLTRLVGLK